jgi:C4-dicarboxylate-specific signal transduction histidine kinase
MSAIAAASFQEVGQPLSAALSSAAASKAWLTQVPPDRKKAIESLDDTIEAGRQTFEIMKNVRARFTGELGGGEEFCLNELVREAALLMDRELTARKVSLQLDLDEPLPRVLGDQTQMRRVLLHLMAELFEPRNDARRQPTRILVRTAASNARYLILDVGDHHTAHIDEEMDQVFGPFCEASENGTGVSLALCRTIIEDHGGYLFVLRIPEHGPRFRLKLPFREPTGQAFA